MSPIVAGLNATNEFFKILNKLFDKIPSYAQMKKKGLEKLTEEFSSIIGELNKAVNTDGKLYSDVILGLIDTAITKKKEIENYISIWGKELKE